MQGTVTALADGAPVAGATVTVSGTSLTTTTTAVAPPCADSFGYTCTSGQQAFAPADQTVLTLTGDDISQRIFLPFPVPFYGQSYSTAWVDTNGLISFAPLPSSPVRRQTRLAPSGADGIAD